MSECGTSMVGSLWNSVMEPESKTSFCHADFYLELNRGGPRSRSQQRKPGTTQKKSGSCTRMDFLWVSTDFINSKGFMGELLIFL